MSDSRDELARKVCLLTVNEKIELLTAVGVSRDVVEQQLTDILLQLIMNPTDSRETAVVTNKLMDMCRRRLLQRRVQNFHSYDLQPVTLQEPRGNEGQSTSQATAPCQLHNLSMFASEQLTSQLRPTVFPPPACFRSQNPQFSLSPYQPDGNIRNLILRPQLPNYTANLTPTPYAVPSNNMASIMPFVRRENFKTDPFFELKLVLLFPTRLRPTNELTLPQDVLSMNQNFRECKFAFTLTNSNGSMISQTLLQSDLNELNIDRHHIVIRIGKFNEGSHFYEQVMPLNLQIRVNQNYVQLRPLQHQCRRVCKYVVITDETQLTPGATNNVIINWVPEVDEIFFFDICIGRIIPYQILFHRILITNCINWNVSLLRVIDLIKHQTEQDGVGRRTVRFSLHCPLSGQRITYPGIGKLCRHIQMFDVEKYIQVNETYNSWTCPICQQCTSLSDLEIHEYISFGVIRSNRLPDNCKEIEFNVDGAWIAIVSGMQQNPTAENNELSTDDENSTTEDIERSDEDETSTDDNDRFSDDDENPTVNENGLSDDNTDFRNTGNAEFTTSGTFNNNYFNLESEILNSNVESAPIITDVIDLTSDE